MIRYLMAATMILLPGYGAAQSSFPTAGGQTVPGIVLMCIMGGQAVPCTGTVTSGPDGRFVTAGGGTVSGAVRMCITGGVAVSC